MSRRRGAVAAAVAAELPSDTPSVPVTDIRVRKWTKQLKTVGHLTILKWVPDQENPTLALQKGVLVTKKTKGGRKRVQTGEVGRMTRSVRQHLDAPLELLQEMPQLRNNPLKHQPAPVPANANADPAAAAAAGPLPALADAAASAQPPTTAPASSEQVPLSSAVATATATVAAELLPGAQGDPLLATTVPSDEQLEMALDDLPMLDSDEDLPFDSLLEDQVPPVVPVAAAPIALSDAARSADQAATVATADAASESAPASVDGSVENTAESAEGEDDDASNSSSGSDNGSAVSGSSLPSPSPQTSPMMSRSPSP